MKRTRTAVAATIAFFAVTTTIALKANDDKSGDEQFKFQANSLVLSRSVYTGDANTVTAGQTLPPACVAGNVTVPLIAGGSNTVAVTCGTAIDNGEYPNLEDSHNVWNNDGPDASFGVTSPIFLDNIDSKGKLISTLAVPSLRATASRSHSWAITAGRDF